MLDPAAQGAPCCRCLARPHRSCTTMWRLPTLWWMSEVRRSSLTSTLPRNTCKGPCTCPHQAGGLHSCPSPSWMTGRPPFAPPGHCLVSLLHRLHGCSKLSMHVASTGACPSSTPACASITVLPQKTKWQHGTRTGELESLLYTLVYWACEGTLHWGHALGYPAAAALKYHAMHRLFEVGW